MIVFIICSTLTWFFITIKDIVNSDKKEYLISSSFAIYYAMPIMISSWGLVFSTNKILFSNEIQPISLWMIALFIFSLFIFSMKTRTFFFNESIARKKLIEEKKDLLLVIQESREEKINYVIVCINILVALFTIEFFY